MFLAIDLASVKNVGRVGALAVALGIGGAVSFTPCVARADDSQSSASESSSSTSESPAAKEVRTGGQRGVGGDRTSQSRTARQVPSGARTEYRRGTGAADLPAAAAAMDQIGSDRSSHRGISGSLPETDAGKTAPALTRIATPPVPAAASAVLPAVAVATQPALPVAVSVAEPLLPAAAAVVQPVLPAAFAVAQPLRLRRAGNHRLAGRHQSNRRTTAGVELPGRLTQLRV